MTTSYITEKGVKKKSVKLQTKCQKGTDRTGAGHRHQKWALRDQRRSRGKRELKHAQNKKGNSRRGKEAALIAKRERGSINIVKRGRERKQSKVS